jgi:transposase InsO family protein
LPLIRDIADERMTYGYRRLCAVLNRRLCEQGLARVNHKRVYRIMKLHGMLLTRHTGKRPQRDHQGKVIVLKRNLRWSSDVFEFACDNAETVRVAFAIDCRDREVIGHVASSNGVSGQMIRDLMLECVEKRFGAPRTLHRIEWLSDNGSCFTARETVDFAAELGLESRFAPVRSPESNGMAEAFVKTFKRDYIYVNDRPSALSVMSRLGDWFEDYNENHPHKGLRMMSPREYIRSEELSASNRCEPTGRRREWAQQELVGGGGPAAAPE